MNSFTLANNQIKYFDGTDSINAYHTQLRKYPPLSNEEETALFKRLEDGDESVLDTIVLHNQRFVYSNAKQYARDEDEVFDYINEGVIGLMMAIEKFKVSSGNRFITYAVWYIRRQMNYYLINTRDTIVKSNAMKMFKKVDRIVDKYLAENGRMPSEEEVVELLEEKYKRIKVKDLRELYEVQVLSIHEITDDDNTFEDSSEFTEKTSNDNEYDSVVDHEYNKAIAHRLLSSLNKREQNIIRSIYGIDCERPLTLDEVCDKYAMSMVELNKLKKDIENRLLKNYNESIKEKYAV